MNEKILDFSKDNFLVRKNVIKISNDVNKKINKNILYEYINDFDNKILKGEIQLIC